MDKSFNDQELSDIMKEIEALEEDFSGEEAVHATSSVLEELAHMEEKEAIPVAAPAPVSLDTKRAAPKPAPVETSAPAATSMSFKVQGNLSLQLQFDIGGKVVSLEVTETGLNIEMDGGMKFTVPVSAETTSRKKAA